MMIADSWLTLANIINLGNGVVPAAFDDVVPKVRTHADALGLTLPPWSETSQYWRDQVHAKEKTEDRDLSVALSVAVTAADADTEVKRVVGRTLIVLGGTLIAAFLAGVFSAGTACAHDPRFACSPRPASSPVAIGDVVKSWAFYGRLASPQRDYYDFSTAVPLRIPSIFSSINAMPPTPARPSLIVEGANQRENHAPRPEQPRHVRRAVFTRLVSEQERRTRSCPWPLHRGRLDEAAAAQRYTFAIGRDERFGILEIPYVLGAVSRIHNRDF